MQRAGGRKHAVTGHDYRKRILGERHADLSGRARLADGPRDFAVAGGRAGPDLAGRGVDPAPECVNVAVIERDPR